MPDNQIPRFKFITDSYEPLGDSQHFPKKIEELGLTIETANALIGAGLSTVGDLCRIQMRHLYRIKALRKKNVFEVLRKLQSFQLDFMRVAKVELVEGEEVATSTESSTATPDNAKIGKKKLDNKSDKQKNGQKKLDGVSDKSKEEQSKRDKLKNGQKKLDNNRDKSKEDQSKRNNKAKDIPKAVNSSNDATKSSESKWGKPNIGDKAKSSESKWGKPNIGTADNKNTRATEGNREKREKFDSKNGKSAGNKGKQASPDAGVSPTIYIVKSRTLREERSKTIEKKIGAIQPLKNDDGLYKFFRAGKWGYKNEGGKVVIEPLYTEAFNFSEGMACVEQDERCGFIDMTGECVIDIKYDTANSFSEGLAVVSINDKCSYIDKTGEVAIPFEYESATSFVNDIALVKKDGKWGYMDRHTHEIRLR